MRRALAKDVSMCCREQDGLKAADEEKQELIGARATYINCQWPGREDRKSVV